VPKSKELIKIYVPKTRTAKELFCILLEIDLKMLQQQEAPNRQ
jgi:hypothetical protein